MTDSEDKNRVGARHWLRLIAVYLLIPLVLFLCAGDLAWWQGWLVGLAIFASGIGARLWAEYRHPGLTAARQDPDAMRNAKAWDKVLAPLMGVTMGFPMLIVAGLDHRYGWSADLPFPLVITGLALVYTGYGFAAWAFAENRFFLSVTREQLDAEHALCDSGPYRLVRHPGYAGNVLAQYGIVLALASPWVLIPATAALVVSVLRIKFEDSALQGELTGYAEYAGRVRYRLIPGLY